MARKARASGARWDRRSRNHVRGRGAWGNLSRVCRKTPRSRPLSGSRRRRDGGRRAKREPRRPAGHGSGRMAREKGPAPCRSSAWARPPGRSEEAVRRAGGPETREGGMDGRRHEDRRSLARVRCFSAARRKVYDPSWCWRAMISRSQSPTPSAPAYCPRVRVFHGDGPLGYTPEARVRGTPRGVSIGWHSRFWHGIVREPPYCNGTRPPHAPHRLRPGQLPRPGPEGGVLRLATQLPARDFTEPF